MTLDEVMTVVVDNGNQIRHADHSADEAYEMVSAAIERYTDEKTERLRTLAQRLFRRWLQCGPGLRIVGPSQCMACRVVNALGPIPHAPDCLYVEARELGAVP